MVARFRFPEDGDIKAHLEDTYGYKGDLAKIYTSNRGARVHKWHHYLPLYDRYFAPFRKTDVKFLEIGVANGGSLQVWRKYFGKKATIYGIDIKESCARFDGIAGQVRIGSQTDRAFLESVVAEMGGVDIVLDDGSHIMRHVDKSMRVLFPLLSTPGIYMIEDLHTAYSERWGGGLEADRNFFNRIRGMIDDMHQWYHNGKPNYAVTHGKVSGIHIHDSITVFEKNDHPRPVHSHVGSEED